MSFSRLFQSLETWKMKVYLPQLVSTRGRCLIRMKTTIANRCFWIITQRWKCRLFERFFRSNRSSASGFELLGGKLSRTLAALIWRTSRWPISMSLFLSPHLCFCHPFPFPPARIFTRILRYYLIRRQKRRLGTSQCLSYHIMTAQTGCPFRSWQLMGWSSSVPSPSRSEANLAIKILGKWPKHLSGISPWKPFNKSPVLSLHIPSNSLKCIKNVLIQQKNPAVF